MIEIRVPQLGESVVEATVARWLKRAGEAVNQDDVLVELETDKVNVDVHAEQAGTLEQVLEPEGATVKVNTVLGYLNANGRQAANPNRPASFPTTAGEGGGIASSAVAGAPTSAPPAPFDPKLPSPFHTTAGEGGGTAPQAPPAASHQPPATPVAAKMAAESGLDLSRVRGTGQNGKITTEDVRSALDPARAQQRAPAIQRPEVLGPEIDQATPAPVSGDAGGPRTAPGVEQPPAFQARGAEERLPGLTAALGRREQREMMSRLRRTIAENLKRSQETAVTLTTFNEVDMTAVMELRKRRRDAFKERHGVSLGFMSFFTRACIGALKAFPNLNAEIQADEIVRKFYYDIGIAVGTDRGLVVPVVRDADRKTFAELEIEIASLASRAREGKLTLPELLGGTFTLTNGGVYGSLMSTPILNAPQVGILGMHKIQERPVAAAGQVVIRPMMYLALSYDHRIVDGSEAVRFLVKVKELIEDPEELLLEA